MEEGVSDLESGGGKHPSSNGTKKKSAKVIGKHVSILMVA